MRPEYPKYTELRVAEILSVDPTHPDSATIERAASCLRDGGLVAFPTETVYGLGADATNVAAVRRIFTAKRRPSTDPLILHVADLNAVRPLVSYVPDVLVTLASALWPGPLTVVLPRSSRVPDAVTAGLDSVAVRVPAHPVARALVLAAGVPVAAPSANLFSRPSPTRAAHVADDLGDVVDMILDGGATQVGLESTVLDLTSDPPRVLRPGGVSIEQLRLWLPAVAECSTSASGAEAMPAPGMLSKHYAPRTPLTLFEGPALAVCARVAEDIQIATDAGRRVVVLGSRESLAAIGAMVMSDAMIRVELGPDADADGMAARLYVCLRDCDAAEASQIFAVQVSDAGGIAAALRDRLRRASAGHVISC